MQNNRQRRAAKAAATRRPNLRPPVQRVVGSGWSRYVDATALLVEKVADANKCRAIQSAAWGFVTVVSHSAELDMVELLVTSLLLEATRAMTLAGPPAPS